MGEMADTITDFARARLKHRVGRGECYDLADEALKKAGAQSAPHYGTITKTADYVWGSEVDLKTAQAGDILQFRNHQIVVETTTVTRETDARGGFKEWTETKTRTYKRGHHTAIVKDNPGGGTLTVYEQHVQPLGGVVQEHVLQVADSDTTSPNKNSTRHTKQGPITVEVTEHTTITVSGTIKAYRPEAKN